MGIKKTIRNLLRSRGYDISYYHPAVDSEYRLNKLLKHYKIQVVIDVGANKGQFGLDLRKSKYKHKIISFEPMKEAFEILAQNAEGDDKWETYNYALGNSIGDTIINVSENSLSSSILEMLPSHEQSAPESIYVGEEQIKMKTLDSIFNSICSKNHNIFLKIDTQGFEKDVLDGAKNSLKFIDTIQLEMSLRPLYEGSMLFDKLFPFMSGMGFRIVNIEQVLVNIETGEMQQIDVIFRRKE